MLTLALDTAGAGASLALGDGGRLLAGLQVQAAAHQQAEGLLPALAALFRLAGRAPADLARLAVAIGPGSYTGLRNGLAVARTLAQLDGIPVFGVDNLTLLAARAAIGGLVSPCLDIRRGEVYTSLLDTRSPGTPAVVAGAGVRQAEDWVRQLAARQEPVVLLGELPAAGQEWLARSDGCLRLVPADRLAPAAATLLRLADAADEAAWVGYEQALPLYPDRPVAQVPAAMRRT